MNEQNRMWMVRAGGGDYFNEFQENNMVKIGWNEVGDLSSVQRDAVRQLVQDAWKDKSPYWIGKSAGQLARFGFDFKVGDNVLTYDKTTRTYLIGSVTSGYEFSGPGSAAYPHVRRVSWEREILRDRLSLPTRNTLGSILTVFEVTGDQRAEILSVANNKEVPKGAPEEELGEIRDDTVERAAEFMKDKISQLNWKEMQDLVAGLLRSMGYKTRVSQPGPDGGRDIVASPDELGLASPRIIVQVKHRKGKVSPDAVRSLVGALKPGDRGLFVSTGGATTQAERTAKEIDVSLIDMDKLVSLIVQYYDEFDLAARSLLPLEKIYWPA